MKQIHIFSGGTVNYVWMIKILCLCMQKYKSSDYVYNYHIMLDTKDIEKYNNIKQLETETFKIEILSSDIVDDKLSDVVKKDRMKMAWIKCLIPHIFSYLDKILWLDTDTLIIKNGLQKIFQLNIQQYYGAAVYDSPVTDEYKKAEGVKDFYFNTGVMLLNLKKMREEGIDKQLENDMNNFPPHISKIHFEQGLFNYRFKQNVLPLSPIYNNIILASPIQNMPKFEEHFKKFGYEHINDIFNDTIILHWPGDAKPWSNLNLPDQFFIWDKFSKYTFMNQIKTILN